MQDTVASAVADAVARDQDGRPVECHETHGSWVIVAGDRALKVKKPVVLPFLDYGTLERRRAMCREELRLNRRPAPELYRGTVSVVARGASCSSMPPGWPRLGPHSTRCPATVMSRSAPTARPRRRA